MNQINKELHAKYDKKFGKDMSYYVPVKTLFYNFRGMAGWLHIRITFNPRFNLDSSKRKNTIENKR